MMGEAIGGKIGYYVASGQKLTVFKKIDKNDHTDQ
jgi:hypothetical protein